MRVLVFDVQLVLVSLHYQSSVSIVFCSWACLSCVGAVVAVEAHKPELLAAADVFVVFGA